MFRLSAHRPLFRHARHINAARIRLFSEAHARFLDPTITSGPRERELDIAIGGPGIASVIVEPGVGSKLVGKQFAEGEKAEVPLLFFHKTKHFAKDDDDACPKLYIDRDLESNVSNGTSSPAILFRFGANSTLAIKGSSNESQARVFAGLLDGIEGSFNRLKDA
ncbi:MAG: hypothetical protein Q9180_008720 [Flavoplaca navasiana]